MSIRQILADVQRALKGLGEGKRAAGLLADVPGVVAGINFSKAYNDLTIAAATGPAAFAKATNYYSNRYNELLTFGHWAIPDAQNTLARNIPAYQRGLNLGILKAARAASKSRFSRVSSIPDYITTPEALKEYQFHQALAHPDTTFEEAKALAEENGYPISSAAKSKDDVADEVFDYENDFLSPGPFGLGSGDRDDPGYGYGLSDPALDDWSDFGDSLGMGIGGGRDPGEDGEDGNYGGEGDGGDSDSGAGKPVILDLDGDGVEYIERSLSTAFFDIDGDGYRNHLGWVSGDDGFLAYDKDGDGRITEYDEISFTGYVEGARTDVEGLRHFDTNGDGRLTSADAEWSSFGVWRDLDSDGEFDAGEFQTLTEAGISSITLSTDGNQREVSGHTVFGSGTYTTDSGATHSFDD